MDKKALLAKVKKYKDIIRQLEAQGLDGDLVECMRRELNILTQFYPEDDQNKTNGN